MTLRQRHAHLRPARWICCSLVLPLFALAPVFAKPPPTEHSRDEAVGDIETTQRALSLIGVFVHSEPARSGAIIATEDGRQRYLGVNDTVAPQISLLRIESSYVILTGAEGLERLSLERARHSNHIASAAQAEPIKVVTGNSSQSPRQSASDEVVRAELNRQMAIFMQSSDKSF